MRARFLRLYAVAIALLPLPFGVAGAAPLSTTGPANPPIGFVEACADYSWLCYPKKDGRALPDAELIKLAHQINTYVNQKVTPETSTATTWGLPSEGKGDCVAYTLMKLRLLLEAGVPASQLRVALVLTPSREAHAVLVLRTRDQDLVLDNLRPEVVSWDKTGHTFIKLQNATAHSKWDFVLLGPLASRN